MICPTHRMGERFLDVSHDFFGDGTVLFQRVPHLVFVVLLGSFPLLPRVAEPGQDPAAELRLEEQPADAKLVKIVLVAGSTVYKPGEHEYVAACALLRDLLR